MQFRCIFYVIYNHENIMNVTGRPTPEMLNKLLFTHIASWYTDISNCMASSKLSLAE